MLLGHEAVAERWLVGALLIGADDPAHRLLDELGDLETIDFYDEKHRHIVRTILDRRDRGDDCGATAIAEDIERQGLLDRVTSGIDVRYLLSLMEDVPSDSLHHVREWVRQVRDSARRRDALLRADEIRGKLQSGRVDLADLADDATRLATVLNDGPSRSERQTSSLILQRVADVTPEPLKPLWPNRFYHGKLNLLCGDPGKGKSLLTADIAARFSRGNLWPDGSPATGSGSVIFFSAEDDVADTILPRLQRAGADLQRVYCLESVSAFNSKTGRMERASFSLGNDVPLLEERVKELGDVGLVVIDPVSSYGGKVDTHKNSDVRSMLHPLTDLAARYGIAIIAVTHLSKGSGGKAVYRATGSLAYAAAARSVWMLAEDTDDPQRRLLLPVKCNIAQRVTGLAFTVEGGEGEPPFLRWDEALVNLTADEHLAREATRTMGEVDDSALTEAVTFVTEQLQGGPVLASELEAAAKAHDISKRTLIRARKQLGCKPTKRDDDGKWEVCLPG